MGGSFKRKKLSTSRRPDSSADSFIRKVNRHIKEGGPEPLVIAFDGGSAGPRIAAGFEAAVYGKCMETANAIDPRRKEAGRLEAEGDKLQDEHRLNKAAKLFNEIGDSESARRCLEKAKSYSYDDDD